MAFGTSHELIIKSIMKGCFLEIYQGHMVVFFVINFGYWNKNEFCVLTVNDIK